MKLERFLNLFREMNVKPMIICKDGLEISIQNSFDHHCGIDSCEVFLPKGKEKKLEPYKNEWHELLFDYVPLEVIEKVLEKHGGILTIADFKGDINVK